MKHPIWRSLVFVTALAVPLFWLYQGYTFALGPDPGKVLVDRLGQGALVLLLLTLCLSPLQWSQRWTGWAHVRRQLGLWCFTYATLHLAGFVVFILGLDLAQLGEELVERPYIIVGALAWLSLAVMALTSNRASMRRLGKRWKVLHRLAYAVLGLGLLHMLWVVRSDIGLWALYFSLGALLMLLRVPPVSRKVKALRRRPVAPPTRGEEPATRF